MSAIRLQHPAFPAAGYADSSQSAGQNWLKKRSGSTLPAVHGWVDWAALGILHIGLFAWAFIPEFHAVGLLLVFGTALNLWRLLRWHGIAVAEEPLLLVLHVGYAWLVLGTALLGLSALGVGLPQSAGIHPLAAGAIGTMILAVMTRATRGHTGRELTADWSAKLIYILVVPEPALETELVADETKTFDTADGQCDDDRNQGNGQVVIELADRLDEGPTISAEHHDAIRSVDE